MKAAAAIFGCGFTIAACYAAGILLLDRLRISTFLGRSERIPLGFLLGASVVHLWIFGLLALQLAYWPLIILPLAAIILWSVRTGSWKLRGPGFGKLSPYLRWVAGVPAVIFLVVYFVYAWAPEHSPDGSSYHLGILARQLRHHGFEKITTLFYAMLGQGVEFVFLPAFVIGAHSAAALTHLSFAVALGLAIFSFGRRHGSPWVGAAAALFTLLSPVFGLDASIAYVDVGAAAIAFAAFYWLEIWDRERDTRDDAWRLLIAGGLMAGYAFAAKYTLFTIGIYAIGFVLFKARTWKPVLLTAGCALLMGGIWIARNWILYNNPAAPMGTAIFRNPYTHVFFEQDFREYFTRMEVEDKRTLPLEVTIRGQKTGGIIGPIFLLLPIALLALRSRTGRHIWVASLLVTSTYFMNVGTRFLIPSLPFFSLSIAMAIGEIPLVLSVLMLAHALLSWSIYAYELPAYKTVWRLSGFPIQEALRLDNEEAFLSRVMSEYAVARMLDRFVPPGEAVFTKSGVADAYTEREIRLWFTSASNEIVNNTFDMGADISLQPTQVLSFRFPARSATRFRLQQTAQAGKQNFWSAHEVHFLREGAEISRSPEWHLQAWPVPWEIQLAFDNSPATRWRSWESAQPGMYINVDFGRDETIDEIRVETSLDSGSVRLQPEVMNASGAWETLPAQFEQSEVPPPPESQRLATVTMREFGVNYILLYENDHLAADVRDHTEAWGLQEIAREGQARLYKILPPGN